MDDSYRDSFDQPEHNPLEEILGAILGPEAAAEIARQFDAQGLDPRALMGAMGPGGHGIPLQQLKYLFTSTSGPVNWDMVKDIAGQLAYRSGDPSLNAAEASQVRQALTIADLWLDPATDFSTHRADRQAWTRVEWVDQTLPGWKNVSEPVAANVARALTDALEAEVDAADPSDLPPEMRQITGSITAALPRLSGMMFGSQIGNALAALSQESLGSTDSGIPLADPSATALVLTNVQGFADGLEIPVDEVLQFVAVRECAHARLFSSVPWLRADLFQALQRYAQEIAIDTEAIAETARSLNPNDLQAMNEAMADGLFAAEPTADQQRALLRLETLLALIEGWVEVVTSNAVTPYLPHAGQLREMMRRRRVSGSPGEQMLAQLVGLQLRPRRARDAARLFQNVEEAEGPGGRDALWAHPDVTPTPAEIDSPDTFLAMRQAQEETSHEFDEDLEKLLAGTLGWAEGLEPSDEEREPGGRADPDPQPSDDPQTE